MDKNLLKKDVEYQWLAQRDLKVFRLTFDRVDTVALRNAYTKDYDDFEKSCGEIIGEIFPKQRIRLREFNTISSWVVVDVWKSKEY